LKKNFKQGLVFLGIMLILAGFGMSIAWAQSADLQTLIKAADDLNEQKDYPGSMAKIKAAEQLAPDDPEVLWRVARAHFNLADQDAENLELQKANIYPGFKYAERCVAADSMIAGGHQYYAILIGRIGEVEGTKQKIENSYLVKEHTLKAIALDPENASNYHVMGRWHYALADLSWFERKIAGLIYAKPPQASFDEAVKYFTKAHELEPDDIRHLLWLGKSYLALNNKTAAKDALQQALALPATTDSERNQQTEATELMKKIK
jgi:hypothetical protein